MLIRPSELSIAEAFVSGDVEIVGNVESAMSIADQIGSRIQSVSRAVALLPKVLALPADDDPHVEKSRYKSAVNLVKPGARRGTAGAIEFHYDVGNKFYALWLDPRMLYTCAYYQTAHDDLATAQTAKLDHICRKLRLQPGETLLDVGCGWGGLVQYAAKHYGVIARGITLSSAQAEWAQRSIAENELGDRCRVEVVDVRDLPASEQYDKISSLGVTEHIPEVDHPAYFSRVYAALKPGGLFMNHCEVSFNTARAKNTMGEKFSNWLWKRDQFIDRYVFPDGRLVALGSIVSNAERIGFETRDIENLREHYTLTLRAWLKGLERHESEATALVGERTFRIWRLYMSAAAHGFNSGAIGLVQTLFSKPTRAGKSNVPLTRHDLYA
jgi:cyclopropane-fatty-acyl-phospholipid synthase